MNKCKLIITVSLCLITAVSFANGFGVSGDPSGQGMSTVTDDSAAAARAQLMGSDPNASTAPKKGTLSMTQIQQILAQQKKNDGMATQTPSSSQPSTAATTGATASATSPDADNNAFRGTAMSQQAFANMLRSMMPLSPDQIKTLRK